MHNSRDLDSGTGFFGPGSLVWIPCPKEVWRPGVVSKVNDSQIVVKVSNVVDELTLEEVSEEVVFKLPLEVGSNMAGGQLHIRAAEQLSDCGVVTPDDLCELTHLHQPSILHAINSRFDLDKIYTFTGPILIAVNPYRTLEGFYSMEMIQKFRLKSNSDIPHVFSVANKAYSGVCNQKKSQTILISGESGAGKTETTKFVLQFLTVVGSSHNGCSSDTGDSGAGGEKRYSFVEDQIIQSNPLLEAFGNSQTLRNNNSSRFGKFIEVQFSESTSSSNAESNSNSICISSARINTYLLEKVRVCHQQKGERNFHIFYQLCSAAKHIFGQGSSQEGNLVYRFPSHNTESILFSQQNSENIVLNPHMAQLRKQLFSNPMEIDLSHIVSEKNFKYLEGSECQETDFHQFERTLYAIRTMGITNSQLYNIIKIIKAVMFLGNVIFVENEGESSIPHESCIQDLEIVSSLLSLPKEDIVRLLTCRKIQLREGEIMKHLSVQEAEATKDAVSKALYSLVFDYILHLVNLQISTGRASEVNDYQEKGKKDLYCGILDIFGFECFPINSFEQLCINFANERLQQIFNDYIFNIEQDLYIQEDISWDPIDFPDNGDCVQLLQQQKPILGILPAIDEECFVPQGSNTGLLNKLVKEYSGKNARFEIVKKNPNNFVVVHYAGPVSYCVQNFIEKNKDQLSQYSTEVLSSSKNPWVSDLLRAKFSDQVLDSESNTKPKRQQTLGSSFRNQLNKLISTIQQTNPHFIRCIKPNGNNSPDEFDRISVSEQLKYGGVLQAIQVSRAGYPVRFPHFEFLLDYMILFSPCGQLSISKSRDEYDKWCRSILHSGQTLEAKNVSSLSASNNSTRKNQIIELMKNLSSSGLISKDEQVTQWAVGVTRVFLKIEAFRDLEQLRVRVRDTASTSIQSVWRMILCRDQYRKALKSIIKIQSIWKGVISRRRFKFLLKQKAALKIQTIFRGHVARQKFRCMQLCVRMIQSRWRVYLRRKEAEEKLYIRRVCLIQSTFRMYLQRRYFVQLSASVLKVQILWRGKLARRQFQKLREERNEFSELFAKYQEALIEIQKLKGNCSRLEDQLYKALSERNALKDEKEQLIQELLDLKSENRVDQDQNQNQVSQNINCSNSTPGVSSQFQGQGEEKEAASGLEISRQKEIIKRLLRLSSYPFSKLELLESIPEILFPQDSRSIVLNYQERQIGLLFAGSSGSGDKQILRKFMDKTGAGLVDENNLQVFTIELSNIPGAHVMSSQECLKGSCYGPEGSSHRVRESSVGERWPLNIMSITSLEEDESRQQIESFLTRTRVAIFVYDVANIESFKALEGSSNDFSILRKAVENGCKVVLFGSLYRVIHDLAKIEVDIEQVRKISSDLDIISIESDSISSLVSSIVGIINARSHLNLKATQQTEEILMGTEGNSFQGQMVGKDELALALERNTMQQKQLNNSLFSKFNDGIRAFGLRIPKFPVSKTTSERNEFLIPTLDLEEAANSTQVEKQGGIGPVINIKDDQNSSVTHIVFCRDIPAEPHTMLLVARKNGVIHAYYCYKTRLEDGTADENLSLDWSGRVEEAYSRKAHNRAITSLALSPDESEFLSTSIDMTVRRFLTATGHAISLFSDNSPVLVGSYLPFLPSLFIVSSSKPLLRIVNVDVGVAQKIKTDSTIRALCFDSTGIYCFAACKEGRIYVLVNIAAKSSSRTSTETDFRFTDKRGMQVCSRAITNMLYVHGSSDYSVRKTHANGAISVGLGGFSSLLPVLVVNAADSTITIIDIRLQAPTGQIDVSNVPHVVLQVRFRIPNPHSLMPLRSCFSSRNGLWVVSAAEDCSVRVFQLNNDSCEKENLVLAGHSAPVISTAVNASSTLLASGDADGIVIIWRRFLRS
ncbi:myosin myosin [Cryptosporidium sp. chipmunk genotype I]|uniref:myosin myosin n=1 Tax=Cryptosporidium sp. chipmunk genotype I TaxID=1280935 RepID=UPI00351A7FB6|nr:myosin myosin [Cryptosporidium sp. chipmunk genotype I]